MRLSVYISQEADLAMTVVQMKAQERETLGEGIIAMETTLFVP